MLDPQRIGLNAASVGFLKRRHEEVDWVSFKKQLQTDDGGCVNVRRIAETPVNEIHVMGGELKGLESNSNLLDRARQHRQMNAYPLRSFSADSPAIILPTKYGGLPMYTRNQVAIQEYVSRFTAPLSASLQQDTQLLGPMGFAANNESAHDPYRPIGFEMNMHKPKIAIDMNEAIIRQRKFLEASSKAGRGNKHSVMNSGVFISADGDPMTHVEVAVDGDRAEINAFHLHKARQRTLMHRDEALAPGGAQTRVPGGGAGMALVQRRAALGLNPIRYVVAPVNLHVAAAPPIALMAGGGALPTAGPTTGPTAGTGGAAAAAGGAGAPAAPTKLRGAGTSAAPTKPLDIHAYLIKSGITVHPGSNISKSQRKKYDQYVTQFVKSPVVPTALTALFH
jgi:hypothetical protein